VIVASFLYCVLFVFAPRQVAAGPGSRWWWSIRFLVFLCRLLTSLIWGGPLPDQTLNGP
jgi:hypothetical protein